MKNKLQFWRKWAASACVLLIAGSMLSGCLREGTMGSQPAMMHYEGPLLPLNAAGDLEGITASREINLDFSGYEAVQKNLAVTDRYLLTNNSGQDKSIDLFYPFTGSIRDSEKEVPAVQLQDTDLSGTLLLGAYAGGFRGADNANTTTHNLEDISSWEGYKTLLEDGGYFAAAQKEKAFFDQQVTVYTFYDVTYPKEYDAATLAMEFVLPRSSMVITYGINGLRFDEESSRHQYSYFLSHSKGTRIIVLGEPPAEYSIAGYENGACEKKVEGISGKVRAETPPLSQVIRDCMAAAVEQWDDWPAASPLVTEELAFQAVASMFQYTALGETPKDRYLWMRLEDLITESYSMKRVMYFKGQIVIPAGQSVTLESRLIKGGSYSFAHGGSEASRGITGYDLMTKLGSNLVFTTQKVDIKLPPAYEIADQNLGLDIAKGVDEISLDMAQEYYYLKIKESGK